VPTELRAEYPNGLSVGLTDRRSKVFELSLEPKYAVFSGWGMTMDKKNKQQQLQHAN